VTRQGDGAPGDAAGYRSSHVGSELAGRYDAGFRDPHSAQGLTWLIEQKILESIIGRHVPSSASALDLACGTGRILALLERHVPRPVGVDVSADMVEVARATCHRAELVVGDVTRRPELVAPEYDLVTSFRFLLNAEPELRADALTFIRRVLAPRGVLIVNFHLNPWSARGLYLQARWLGRRRIPMMSPRSARRLLRGAGLEVVEVVGYDYLPYRRDGSRQLWPGIRAKVEQRLAGRSALRPVAGSFIVVAKPTRSTGPAH
jgi:SAM-dependent methyltransferase